MDNKIPDGMITNNQTVLCSGMFNRPRLTPTGKISHAKTRVYTQRYRKEWEQMPDFKGWLTSVPLQATRAFCTYCNKNLHAHRLSLLKHTCTMKHQRAALTHQNEMNSKQAAAVKIAEIEAGYEEEGDSVVHIVEKEVDCDAEDDNEEYEYVVERLDIDEEDMEEARSKREEQDEMGQEEEEDYEEGNIEQGSMDEDDPLPINNKIKVEREDEHCRDALAEAMAHVHGEYLDGTEDQVNVELEMVVTSEDGVIQESEHDASMTIMEDDVVVENHEQEDVKQQNIKSLAEGDSSEVGSESEISPKRMRRIDQSYQQLTGGVKPSTISVVGSPFNAVPSSSGHTKTLKLNTGKTVTIRTGTQYVLSNVKGNNLPTLLMGERKGDGSVKTERIVNNGSQQGNSYSAVAGTSQQQSSSQKTMIKTEPNKKPCISTHVMDTSKGLPVGGLQVSLYKLMDGRWTFLNESNTSPNGRCADLVDSSKCNFTAGRYKMHFDVDKYFTLRRIETMYPFIEIVFDVKNPTGNYHIPVLLSPFGYTTYRGSDR